MPLRVEYAAPGTDPTGLPSRQRRSDAPTWLFGLLLVIVVVGLVQAPKMFRLGKMQPTTTVVTTATPVPHPTAWPTPTGCEIFGFRVPVGDHHIGSHDYRCAPNGVITPIK